MAPKGGRSARARAKAEPRRDRGGGFEVVPAGAARAEVVPGGAKGKRGGARGAGATNPLQNARKRPRSEALIWRKLGIGEALFGAYYRGQPGLDLAEPAAFARFSEALHTPLPLGLRLNARAPADARDALVRTLRGLGARELVWFPEQLGWELALHALEPAARAEAKLALLSAARRGLLCRQEAVSMLPALLLAPAAGDRVLDLCSAPGSKAMQILEALGAPAGGGGSRGRGDAGDGLSLLVCNDSHPLRVRTLAEAIARHGGRDEGVGGCPLVLSCGLAQHFPLAPAGSFSHVLADVPCSGDGTARKDARALSEWSPAVGLSLHETQLQIVRRALHLAHRAGGRVVFSTCSLNPVEDEAVVCAALAEARAADDAAARGEAAAEPSARAPAGVVLDDAYALLSARGVPCARGLTDWRVATLSQPRALAAPRPYGGATGGDGGDDDDDDDEGLPQLCWLDAPAGPLPRTLWPPRDGARAAELRASLGRCARLLPHAAGGGGCELGGGGFFLAAFTVAADGAAGAAGASERAVKEAKAARELAAKAQRGAGGLKGGGAPTPPPARLMPLTAVGGGAAAAAQLVRCGLPAALAASLWAAEPAPASSDELPPPPSRLHLAPSAETLRLAGVDARNVHVAHAGPVVFELRAHAGAAATPHAYDLLGSGLAALDARARALGLGERRGVRRLCVRTCDLHALLRDGELGGERLSGRAAERAQAYAAQPGALVVGALGGDGSCECACALLAGEAGGGGGFSLHLSERLRADTEARTELSRAVKAVHARLQQRRKQLLHETDADHGS